jgi:hypothetical protein
MRAVAHTLSVKAPDPDEQVNPDEALIRAWNLGHGEGGRSDAVMDEAERLLPILVDAGYVAADAYTWRFTEDGIARVDEIRRADSTEPPGSISR